MTLVRVQHAFKHVSGLAEDDIINTFYFEGALPADAVQGEALATLVNGFYGNGPTVADRVAFYLHEGQMPVIRNHVKCYNMADPPKRVPFYSSLLSAGERVTTAGLPSEVALCLSYSGTMTSGQNPASKRGRIYIGPLNVNAAGGGIFGAPSRPAPEAIDTLVDAGVRLAQDADGIGWNWVIFSPKLAGEAASLDAGTTTITQVSVDDAWDSQRMRGVAPLARTVRATNVP